jgi:purine-binding chemotaxis protein CheW
MQQLDAVSGTMSFARDGAQYLTFPLGGQEYGVEILKVQEIRGYSPITPIPNTPPHIRGVMNLRGVIIPVVDLRRKLSMPAADYNAFTVIIVVTVGAKVIGLVVDGVSDVLNIAPTAVQPTPDFGGQVDARYIEGLARAGDKLVVLLDIERVIGDDALVP